MKASPAQSIVLARMRDGWALVVRRWAGPEAPYIELQQADTRLKVKWIVFSTLERRGLIQMGIESPPSAYPNRREYVLTPHGWEAELS